jgi:phenylalanyl-tRNA synthetase beta subunit
LTEELAKQKPDNSLAQLEPLDIYKNGPDSHMAFRLTIASYERTLTAEEVNTLLDSIATSAEQALKLQRI